MGSQFLLANRLRRGNVCLQRDLLECVQLLLDVALLPLRHLKAGNLERHGARVEGTF